LLINDIKKKDPVVSGGKAKIFTTSIKMGEKTGCSKMSVDKVNDKCGSKVYS
jgi:hypothetical protein